MSVNVRVGSKRTVCGCGRLFNSGAGHDQCCVCRFGRLSGDDDDLQIPPGWTIDELAAVLSRGDQLRAMGVIGDIACQLVRGKRCYVVDGRAYSLEDLDLHLAKLLRVHHEQQAAMAEYAKRRRRFQVMLAWQQSQSMSAQSESRSRRPKHKRGGVETPVGAYRIPECDVRLLAIRDDTETPEDRLRFAVRGELLSLRREAPEQGIPMSKVHGFSPSNAR